MKYKMKFMGIILGAVMLSGCGSSSDGDGSSSEVSIVGTWKEDCTYIEIGQVSLQETWIFNSDNTFSYNDSEYPTQNCTGVSSESYTIAGTYNLGNETTSSDGQAAQEINFSDTELGDYYMMARYSSTSLIFSDGPNNTESGTSPEERLNNFEGANSFTKQ